MIDAALPSFDVYRGTLQRAAEILGDPEKLARYLRVPPTQLFRWLSGHDKPPVGVFLSCVDLVLEDKRMSLTQLFWSPSRPREPKS